jgi:hypothetical protein
MNAIFALKKFKFYFVLHWLNAIGKKLNFLLNTVLIMMNAILRD